MTNYNLEKLKILVIEQNPLTSDAIQLLLKRLGIEDVEFSPAIDSAFDIFKNQPLDLVISDWSPSIDGIRFLEMVRNDNAKTNPFIPIIILSAFSETDQVKKAVNAGINDFIPKPFTARRIYKRIKKVIEVPHFYVRSGLYFGPCRRHLEIAPHHSNENDAASRYAGNDRRIRDIDIDDASLTYRSTFN